MEKRVEIDPVPAKLGLTLPRLSCGFHRLQHKAATPQDALISLYACRFPSRRAPTFVAANETPSCQIRPDARSVYEGIIEAASRGAFSVKVTEKIIDVLPGSLIVPHDGAMSRVPVAGKAFHISDKTDA